MALTPIPYTKNWFDTFGSQIVPDEASAGTAAKKAAIQLLDGPRITTGSTVSVTFNHADQMEIDWGDGANETHNPGGGAKTHIYTRNGNFQIWCKVIQAPDIRVIAPIRISSLT